MRTRLAVALLLAAGLGWLAGVGRAQAPAPAEEKSFKSADGVKLMALFHKSPKGSAAPVVLMLHPLGADPNEPVWADTANLLVEKGYNVLRLIFRGHGDPKKANSREVLPAEFWAVPFNKANVRVKPGVIQANANSIDYTLFSPGYFPMLVQDIAAARHLLDQMNDVGDLNTSSVYLFGVGDAANLGILFTATEWLRERVKPNVGIPPSYVSTKRDLFPEATAAGVDIAGGVWIAPVPNKSINEAMLKSWVISPYALKMRNETPMLFVYGEKDSKFGGSADWAKKLYKDVLLVDAKVAGSTKLLPPSQTFLRDIKGTALTGSKLLGNNLGTEKMIEGFLAEVEKERRGKPRKAREWDKPLYIDLSSFGIK